MNICYLIRSFSNSGGTESYVYNISIVLTKMGHTVHIVSTTDNGRWDFGKFKNKIILHKINFKERPFTGSWLLERIVPLYAWRYGYAVKRALKSIIKDYEIDLVESTDWAGDTWACSKELEIPICVRMHGYPGFKEIFDKGRVKKGIKNYLLWSLQRRNILNANLVTAVSKDYANFAIKMWEIDKIDPHIIPIGIDSNVFHTKAITREEKVVFFAGRMEKSKGIEIIAKAIPLILKKIPDIKFYLAGRDIKKNGSEQTWSEYLIKNFGENKIIYLGALQTQELVKYYQLSTIFIAPSLYEPGGTVAFEAMACGCPIVVTKVGGHLENIRDMETGLLIPENNEEALTTAIIELLQNKQLREQLSQKAIKSIKNDFSLERIAKKTMDTYVAAINQYKINKNA